MEKEDEEEGRGIKEVEEELDEEEASVCRVLVVSITTLPGAQRRYPRR